MHLLTREAFQVYFRQLKPDGVLAVHVTNTYLDLGRPVAALARSLGREAHLIVNQADDAGATFSSDWMLVGTGLSPRLAWIGGRETPLAPCPARRLDGRLQQSVGGDAPLDGKCCRNS